MKTFKELREGSRSIQGTLFDAMLRIENIRNFIRKGTIEGNEIDKSITFLLNDGTQIKLLNVKYDRRANRFNYDTILGADYPRSADISNVLKDEADVCFNTDDK